MPCITGFRPEVVDAVIDKIVAPVGAIGGRFFPKTTVAEKTGDLFVKSLDADIEVSARSSETADYDEQDVADKSVAYACTESPVSYRIPVTREKSYGNIDKVDQVGVVAAGRAVLRKFEKDAATKIFGAKFSTATTLTDGRVLMGLNEKAISVARYAGHTVLAGSTRFFANLVLASDVSEKLTALMGATVLSADGLAQAFTTNPELIGRMVRMFSPVEEVLVGDDAIWGAKGEDVGIIARVPTLEQIADPNELDLLASSEPIFGTAAWFMPDPASPGTFFTCRSYYNEKNDCDTYKGYAWYDQQILNPDALACVKFKAGTSPAA